MNINTSEKSFVITFNYNEHVKNIVKLCHAESRYKDRAWYLPIKKSTAIAVKKLQEQHGFTLSNKTQEKITELLDEKPLTNEPLPISGSLKNFQVDGVEFMLSNRQCINADDMGLGKTIQTIACIAKINLFPCVIVCPASIKINWAMEIKKWIPILKDEISIISSKNDNLNKKVIIINYDILEKYKEKICEICPKILVLDESHRVKNYKTKKVGNERLYSTSCVRAAKEISKNVQYRFALSGTPILNRNLELASQLDIIGRIDEFGGFFRYAQRYCGATENKWGWDMKDSTNCQELNEKLVTNGIMIRRLKNVVWQDRPEKIHQNIFVELDNFDEYKECENDIFTYLERRNENPDSAKRAEFLVLKNRLRKLVYKGKMKMAFDWISDFIEKTQEKLVVFCVHKECVDAIAKKFGGLVINGETSQEDRQKNVESFQNDQNCKLIVCNIKAGGVGITLTAASTVLFLELSWTPGEMEQAEDRIYRIGQGKNCTIFTMLSVDSVENEINDMLRHKRDIVNSSINSNLQYNTREKNISLLLDF